MIQPQKILENVHAVVAARQHTSYSIDQAFNLLTTKYSDSFSSFIAACDDANDYIDHPDDFYGWFVDNESDYLTFLYRGSSSAKYPMYEIDPTESVRLSLTGNNFYNIMLSNVLKSWQQFPPRNKSLICSTDVRYTGNFGHTQMVFTPNNTELGVCIEFDVWNSFPHVVDTFSSIDREETADAINCYAVAAIHLLFNDIQWPGRSTNGNNTCVNDYLNVLNNVLHRQNDDVNVTWFVKEMVEATMHVCGEDSAREFAAALGVHMKRGKTLYEFFDMLFDPKANGFSITTQPKLYKKRRGSMGREVWFSAPAMMISFNERTLKPLYSMVNQKVLKKKNA